MVNARWTTGCAGGRMLARDPRAMRLKILWAGYDALTNYEYYKTLKLTKIFIR